MRLRQHRLQRPSSPNLRPQRRCYDQQANRISTYHRTRSAQPLLRWQSAITAGSRAGTGTDDEHMGTEACRERENFLVYPVLAFGNVTVR